MTAPHDPSECPRLHDDHRPCPYVSCRHHLWHEHAMSEARPRSGRPAHRRASGPWDLRVTCSIDAAIDGPADSTEIASRLGISDRWVRHIIETAMDRVAVGLVADAFEAVGVEADVWSETRPAHLEVCVCVGDGEVIRCDPYRLIERLASGETDLVSYKRAQ